MARSSRVMRWWMMPRRGDAVEGKQVEPSGVDVDVHIDIWSDVICPWCYLGKRRLERAIAQLGWGPDELTVRYRAYQLDPRATREPRDLRAAVDRKYGPGAFDGMNARLSYLGAEEGIDYRFDLAVRVSTVDAHRLLAWAFAQGGAAAQGSLKERLFLAYFTEGRNVADEATLCELVADVGLDERAAAEVLSTGAFADEVIDDLEGAVERGLTGVPAFVVNDQLLIPGAQDVDVFVRLLSRIHSAT
jgi:predicted DsbA family dithiol-disulfide isomerase